VLHPALSTLPELQPLCSPPRCLRPGHSRRSRGVRGLTLHQLRGMPPSRPALPVSSSAQGPGNRGCGASLTEELACPNCGALYLYNFPSRQSYFRAYCSQTPAAAGHPRGSVGGRACCPRWAGLPTLPVNCGAGAPASMRPPHQRGLIQQPSHASTMRRQSMSPGEASPHRGSVRPGHTPPLAAREGRRPTGLSRPQAPTSALRSHGGTHALK